VKRLVREVRCEEAKRGRSDWIGLGSHTTLMTKSSPHASSVNEVKAILLRRDPVYIQAYLLKLGEPKSYTNPIILKRAARNNLCNWIKVQAVRP